MVKRIIATYEIVHILLVIPNCVNRPYIEMCSRTYLKCVKTVPERGNNEQEFGVTVSSLTC